MAEVVVVVPPTPMKGTISLNDPGGRAPSQHFARCSCGWLFRVSTSDMALDAARLHQHPSLIVTVNRRG